MFKSLFCVILLVLTVGCGGDEEPEPYVAEIVSITYDEGHIIIEFDKSPNYVEVTANIGNVLLEFPVDFQRDDPLIILPCLSFELLDVVSYNITWLSGERTFANPCP